MTWMALCILLPAGTRAGNPPVVDEKASPAPFSIDVAVVKPDVFGIRISPATTNDTELKSPPPLKSERYSIARTRNTVTVYENKNMTRAVWSGAVSALDGYGRLRQHGLRIAWKARDGEALYGLGQRFNGLNQAGRKCEMWIRDEPGQAGGEASYFCTPVVFNPGRYAFFADDNPEGDFDLNSAGDGWNVYSRAGESCTFFVAAAPSLKELLRQRASIQGPFKTIPDWAWGVWMSRNSYEKQSEAEEAIHGMVERDIPLSVIVQEAWKGKSEEGGFNRFSAERWPDLDAYFKLCAKHGIRTILWQVPIIHPSSPEYQDAAKAGYFVKAPDGSVRKREHWLDGFANIDFTSPAAVEFWKNQLRPLVRRGVSGFKADDGEDIEADDAFADGRRGWQVHNQYSVLYAKALYELFAEENTDGLLWCRSGSLGLERFPILWAGDQYGNWDQLRSLIPAGLSASLSGMPFWGHDIGGYIAKPETELYIRWAQFGAFCPIMQFHGQTPREPWYFGDEAEKAVKKLAHMRMNLWPAFAALGREAVATGLPIMRPMSMEFPDDARFLSEDSQYMIGHDLLVAPILSAGTHQRTVKFPPGVWRHLLEPRQYTGPSEEEIELDLQSVPVFVRVGSRLKVQLSPNASLGTWNKDMPIREISLAPVRHE